MEWENYVSVHTIKEALDVLNDNSGEAWLLAGGTDLMLQIRQGEKRVKVLVGIEQINELRFIREENDWMKIGSLVTYDELSKSPLLREKARVLTQAARSVGSPQIRNLGTLAGNIVSAQPAGDGAIALLTLDARVCIVGSDYEKKVPVADTFIGPGKSHIDPTREIITHFEFKSPDENEATAFVRLSRREAMSLPTCNLGIWLKTDDECKTVTDVRIAMGPVARVPYRARKAEAVLRGEKLTGELLRHAEAAATQEAQPRDSFRGSAEYKKAIAGVLLRRAVVQAFEELGGKIA